MYNVVVTGGSRGIGLAIAQRLAGAGYHVIAVARRESNELRASIGEAAKQGRGGLVFRAFDLSEIDAIPAFVKTLRDEFGAICSRNKSVRDCGSKGTGRTPAFAVVDRPEIFFFCPGIDLADGA